MVNVATQYLCVRGVNRLTAISSALTITIVLNVRKFASLALSVAIFGNTLAPGVKIGAAFVATGASWYAFESKRRTVKRYFPPLLPLSGAFSNFTESSRANGGLLSTSSERKEMSFLPKPFEWGYSVDKSSHKQPPRI